MRRHYDAPAREKQAPPLKSSRKLLWRSRSYGLLEPHNCKRTRRSVQPVRVSVLNGGFNRFSRFACDDLVFKDLTIGRQLRTIDLGTSVFHHASLPQLRIIEIVPELTLCLHKDRYGVGRPPTALLNECRLRTRRVKQ